MNNPSHTAVSHRTAVAVLLCLTLSCCWQLAMAQESSATDATLSRIEALRGELDRDRKAIDGDDQEQLADFVQLQRRERDLGVLLDQAVAALDEQAGPGSRTPLERWVSGHFASIRALLDETGKRMQAIRGQRSGAPSAELIEFEYRLREYDEVFSALLRDFLDNVARAGRLGINADAQLEAFDRVLIERADALSDRMQIAIERLDATAERAKQANGEQKSSLESEQAALAERQQRIKTGLQATVELLRERGHDVSRYVQLLISTTGEISGDIFDSKVLFGLADEWLAVIRAALAEDGPGWVFKILVFIVIVAVFRLLANLAARMVRRTVSSATVKFSTLLQEFFVTAASNAVLLLGVLIALSQLGVELGPVLAGMGVAGLVIGFALQDTLSNFASGMMILVYRPFDVGDVVEAGGVSGKVSQMSLVSTTIMTFDNQKLVVPNNKIWGDVIRNVNAEPRRRVDLLFGISYEDDIDKADAILHEIVAAHELVLADPEPTIRLHTLGESSVDFIVRPWVNTPDYWAVYWDVTRTVKQRFDAEGISIPYPQRDVHLYQEKAD